MSWSFSSIHLPTVGCLVFFLPPHSLCAPPFNASGGTDIHQRHRARFVCAGPCDGRGDSDKGAGDTCGHHPAGHCHRLAPNMRCRCGSKRRGDWRAVHVPASNTRGAHASVCLSACLCVCVSVCVSVRLCVWCTDGSCSSTVHPLPLTSHPFTWLNASQIVVVALLGCPADINEYVATDADNSTVDWGSSPSFVSLSNHRPWPLSLSCVANLCHLLHPHTQTHAYAHSHILYSLVYVFFCSHRLPLS